MGFDAMRIGESRELVLMQWSFFFPGFLMSLARDEAALFLRLPR